MNETAQVLHGYRKSGELADHKRRSEFAEQEPKPTVSEANAEVATMIADKLAIEREER